MPMIRRKYAKKGGLRRKRVYRKRAMYRKKTSLHAPKSFVSTIKLQDITAAASGTYADGYSRNKLSVQLNKMPIWNVLNKLYGQFAITGVKFEYRTHKNVSDTASWVSNMIYAEDKNNTVPTTVAITRSQDNVSTLISSRNWSRYVKLPRPVLYQSDVNGARIFTITPSKQIHWMNNDADCGALDHLAAQLNVQESQTVTPVPLGELWVKIYVVCKEQYISQSVSDATGPM